jgi:hypothetical protein
MGGACSTYGEERGVYKDLVGKLEGKRSLGRTRRRWEHNIMMGLQQEGEPGISVGIATGYGLDGPGIELFVSWTKNEQRNI